MRLQIVSDQDNGIARRLRGLPVVSPSAQTMAALESMAAGHHSAPTWRWPVALAASIMTLIAALVIYQPADQQSPQSVAATDPVDEVVDEEVETLLAQSAYLDRMLAGIPNQARVRRVGTASTITALEDRVANIDWQLTAATASKTDAAAVLLRERVGLMSSLLALRRGDIVADTVWL
ncbi:MAG: hypothetical protein AB8F65_09695 [Woeseiaceae bacterium]